MLTVKDLAVMPEKKPEPTYFPAVEGYNQAIEEISNLEVSDQKLFELGYYKRGHGDYCSSGAALTDKPCHICGAVQLYGISKEKILDAVEFDRENLVLSIYELTKPEFRLKDAYILADALISAKAKFLKIKTNKGE